MEAVREKKRIYSYVIFYGRGNLDELGTYPVHTGWEPVKNLVIPLSATAKALWPFP